MKSDDPRLLKIIQMIAILKHLEQELDIYNTIALIYYNMKRPRNEWILNTGHNITWKIKKSNK
jgi:hypothetical protein